MICKAFCTKIKHKKNTCFLQGFLYDLAASPKQAHKSILQVIYLLFKMTADPSVTQKNSTGPGDRTVSSTWIWSSYQTKTHNNLYCKMLKSVFLKQFRNMTYIVLVQHSKTKLHTKILCMCLRTKQLVSKNCFIIHHA